MKHMANFNTVRLFLVIGILSLNFLSWIIQNPGMMGATNQWPITAQDVTQNHTHSHSPSNNYCPPQDPNYTVSFISPSQYDWGTVYSGMWWQSIDSMLQTNYSRVGHLEGVTFLSFENAKRVMQAADWLDFSVEHLSKYVKHFHFGRTVRGDLGVAMRSRVGEILSRYVDKAKQSCHHGDASSSSRTNMQSAIPFTIAILPIRIPSEIAGAPDSHLAMLQLTATIASLWNVGVPRVVVAGIDDNEKVAAQQAFRLLREHLAIRSMELEYIPMVAEEEKLVPKVAMVQFQNAIREYRRMNERGGRKTKRVSNSTDHSIRNITHSWLGGNPSRWKYIYFAEADLILHIRPEAVPSLSKELKRGHLLNAHRLQPLPHMQQFMDIYGNASSVNAPNARVLDSKLLPNLANFASIHNLGLSTRDSCCDQGLFYPGNVDESSKFLAVRRDGNCSTEWAFCGFSRKDGDYSNWAYVLEKHKLLMAYPFLSLERGTGVPLVHHGQRVCIPKRGTAASCK